MKPSPPTPPRIQHSDALTKEDNEFAVLCLLMWMSMIVGLVVGMCIGSWWI